MTDINDLRKWNAFVERLLERTQRQEIEWSDWSDRIRRPEARSPLFVAVHKEWRILIFRCAYKYYQDEDRFDWEEDVAIELIDKDGKTEWLLPKVPSRHQLLDYIQYKHADVEALFADIVGPDGFQGDNDR